MYSTSDFRTGLKVEINGDPYIMVYFQHVKPGKGGAFVRTKLKNMISQAVIEKTFRSGEKVKQADIEEKDMSYLYQDGSNYVMMDNDTYEQTYISAATMADAVNYLKENMDVKAIIFKGKPISVELPIFVELAVAETDPGVKGDTASGGSKPATLETGAVIQVPLFINAGDVLKIDTRSGEYIERVQK